MSLSPLLGLPGKVKTLIDRLTALRATALDYLDASILSRAPASTALSSATWTGTKAGYLDAAISSMGPIQSIQTGYVSIDAGSWSTGAGEDAAFTNVTITAVVVAKSIVFWQQGTDLETGGSTTNRGPSGSTARLTSTTNLRASVQVASSNTLRGRWTVVEFK